MLSWLKLISLIFVFIVIGYFFLNFVFRNKDESIIGMLPFSFGIGVGVFTFLIFFLMLVGFPLNSKVIILSISILLIFALYRLFRNKDNVRFDIHFSKLSAFEYILLFFIFICIGLIFLDTLSRPLYHGDALEIWAFKAKILYYMRDIRTSDFFTKNLLHPHQNYPLLTPILEASIYKIIGRIDETLIKTLFPVFWIFILLLFYSFVRSMLPRNKSLISVAILASLLIFLYPSTGISRCHNDIPLSFFYTAAVLSAYRWLKNDNTGNVFLSAFFFSAAIFTKNEGIGLFVVWIIITLSFLLLNKHKDISKIFSLLKASGFLIILVLPWFIFRHYISNSVHLLDENYLNYLKFSVFINNIGRIPYIISYFIKELFNPLHWGIFWVLFLVTGIFYIKSIMRTRLKYIVLLIIFDVILYIGIYIITPANVVEQMRVTLDRLLMHITPLATLVFSIILFRQWGHKEKVRNNPI